MDRESKDGDDMGSSLNVTLYPEQELTRKILEGAFAVHNTLGCGFLEAVYANALLFELRSSGLQCEREILFKVKYKDNVVGDYCADLIVEKRVLVELKACAGLDSGNEAQILNYLKASSIHVGLLMNFGKPKLQYRRFVRKSVRNFICIYRFLSVFICVHLWIELLVER
jgi:GxxExxY protein